MGLILGIWWTGLEEWKKMSPDISWYDWKPGSSGQFSPMVCEGTSKNWSLRILRLKKKKNHPTYIILPFLIHHWSSFTHLKKSALSAEVPYCSTLAKTQQKQRRWAAPHSWGKSTYKWRFFFGANPGKPLNFWLDFSIAIFWLPHGISVKRSRGNPWDFYQILGGFPADTCVNLEQITLMDSHWTWALSIHPWVSMSQIIIYTLNTLFLPLSLCLFSMYVYRYLQGYIPSGNQSWQALKYLLFIEKCPCLMTLTMYTIQKGLILYKI